MKCNSINWRNVQRKNAANNVDMLGLRGSWQNGAYKNQHTEQIKNTRNTKTQQTFRQNCVCVCVFVFAKNSVCYLGTEIKSFSQVIRL